MLSGELSAEHRSGQQPRVQSEMCLCTSAPSNSPEGNGNVAVSVSDSIYPRGVLSFDWMGAEGVLSTRQKVGSWGHSKDGRVWNKGCLFLSRRGQQSSGAGAVKNRGRSRDSAATARGEPADCDAAWLRALLRALPTAIGGCCLETPIPGLQQQLPGAEQPWALTCADNS